MQAGVTLITPTGGRQQAFSLCQRYVERQVYAGQLQWIIVDDCIPAIELGNVLRSKRFMDCNWEVLRLNPSPSWSPSDNTLARNLRTGLQRVRYDTVLIIEDDDWYAPDYVITMQRLIKSSLSFLIAGSDHSCYYNTTSSKYQVYRHPRTSSLCHTVFRASEINKLYDVCDESSEFIDRRFWSQFRNYNKGFLSPINGTRTEIPLCVGIRGLPGRPGIGSGHRLLQGTDVASDDNYKEFSSCAIQ